MKNQTLGGLGKAPVWRLLLGLAGCACVAAAQAADPTTPLSVDPKEVDESLSIAEVYPPKTVIRRPRPFAPRLVDTEPLRPGTYNPTQIIAARGWPRPPYDKRGAADLQAKHETLLKYFEENKITIKADYPDTGIMVLQLPERADPKLAVAALQKSELVEFAELDYAVSAAAIPPGDLAFSSQWGLHNVGQSGLGNNPTNNGPANVVGVADIDIDAPEGWAIRNNAQNMVVAVIDSGIHFAHEDLKGNMWKNPNEVLNGKDDDGNGYIDDIHGANFIAGNGIPMDDNGHGTHVAGIVGAETDNAKGVAGVAWKVKLMALKSFNSGGGGYISTILGGVDYALKKKADIINASFGYSGGFSNALYLSLSNADAAGVIVVAAAGNQAVNIDTSPFYPAAFDLANIVSVAATDRAGKLAYYSNYGSAGVDIAAPGTAIQSTTILPGVPTNTTSYASLDGTSMAAPHVAGTLALMKAHYPGESHIELIEKLLSTVEILPSLIGKMVTSGHVNLERALSCEVPLLKTFCNLKPIKINDLKPATPYPSAITVSGVTGTVSKVTVKLNSLTHTYPADIDLVLVGPQGQKVMLMSDAGGFVAVLNKPILFDDTVTTIHPLMTSLLGNSKPVDYAPADTMPAPAPAGPYSSSLSVFNNITPNGVWKLYAYDDEGADVGLIKGWCLNFTLRCPSHLLLAHQSAGYAVVADMDYNDNWTALRAFGPYPGWTATSVHSDPSANNDKRILWSHPWGIAVLQRFDSNWTFKNIGIYTTPNWFNNPGFVATSYNRTPSGAHGDIVWSNPINGGVLLQKLFPNTDAAWTTSALKQYPGWLATSLQRYPNGANGKLLFTNNNGSAQLRNVSGASIVGLPQNFGPFATWSAQSYNLDAHNKARILWSSSNYNYTIWTVGTPTSVTAPVGPLSHNNLYGPYPGWTATSYFR